ncbi:tetratricopeptide repeat protein [Winogradskyella aurantiaca]|uniref:tetratricopeptide repeat protein n=1 Tax=Winogradskyella aurantiaca TaxID=2219558 RepID=UPI000E1CDE20|nr:tetratricopeptide repeat protein [Winogradskyella aurantiaca]
MKRCLSLFLFLIVCGAWAQTTLQQLQANRDAAQSNLEQVEALLSLSQWYESKDLDSSRWYLKQALALSKLERLLVKQAEVSAALGYNFVRQNNLDSAKVYYQEAMELYRDTDSTFQYARNTMLMGNINLAQNNYIESLSFYQQSLEMAEEASFEALLPHLYNNMGLLYKQIEDYDDAQLNFSKAYDLFLKQDDEPNSVYPLYNIALINSIQGKDDQAIEGYLNLTGYHLKNENWLSLASIYNSVSEIYLNNGELEKAEEFLDMALNALENKSDSFNTGPKSLRAVEVYSNAAEVYYQMQEWDAAAQYAHKGLKMSQDNSYKLSAYKSAKVLADVYDAEKQTDSALHYYKIYTDFNQQYQDENDVKQLTTLKLQNEFDAILKQKEIDLIYKEAAYKNRELKLIGFIVLGVFLVAILVLAFFNQKNKNAKLQLAEDNLKLEKKQLEQDLDYKKKDLVSKLMYLLEKNEFITSISKQLIELKPDAKKDNKEVIQQIINEIRINSSQKLWDEFELRFKEVHIDFYNRLNEAHPDLTPNEIKICAFLRLNMSSKEISAITHQSLKSINMARFRLRKKLDIDRDENLIAYLSGL